jgi:hypothetical protein
MYFIISKEGCSEYKGMVDIRYDLYLDKGDYRYDDFYLYLPVLEEYPKQKELDAARSKSLINEDMTWNKEAADERDKQEIAYKEWLETLKKEWQNTPFYRAFHQFEPTVTQEEIETKGKEILKGKYKHFQDGDLYKPLYEPPVFSAVTELQKQACVDKVASISTSEAIRESW